MGRAYSEDLRRRICDFVAAGHSRREAARVFSVSASTAIRLVASERRQGDIAPKRQGRAPGTGKLAPYMAFLLEIVEAEPDITLRELAGALETGHAVRVQLSSLHRALARAKLSYKKRPDRRGAPAARTSAAAA